MSEKIARVHSQGANRAKKHDNEDRKTVYKTVLDNPFRIQWPSIPMNVQNDILLSTISMMQGVAEYNQLRKKANRKRRKNIRNTTNKKERISNDGHGMNNEATTDSQPSNPTLSDSGLQCPKILRHLVVGINEVTKRLESQLRKSPQSGETDDVGESCGNGIQCTGRGKKPHIEAEQPPLAVLLVCKNDVNPAILVDHLPYLVAAHNSAQETISSRNLKLVTLPIGAENKFAQALGLPRAAVIGIDANAEEFISMLPSLSRVPILTASWLTMPQELVPSHIKRIKTTSPKDIKAEKQKRKNEKTQKREQHKRRKVCPTGIQDADAQSAQFSSVNSVSEKKV